MNYKKAEKEGEKKNEERGENRDNNDMKWEGMEVFWEELRVGGRHALCSCMQLPKNK